LLNYYAFHRNGGPGPLLSSLSFSFEASSAATLSGVPPSLSGDAATTGMLFFW
jgi:hypothetical protein